MSLHRDACGCQWQDAERTVLFSHCTEHQLQSRLVDMHEAARDTWLRRLMDSELDHMIREYARGRRVEPKMALGPAPFRPSPSEDLL